MCIRDSTNYAATYATGLLCARRLLTKYDLAETYEGNTDNIGEDFNVQPEGERQPFKCFLDVGLVRTSTGSRVFAALKGAVDGGLNIPHNDKRYAGYDLQDKSLDPETLERYIKGGVVAEYAEEQGVVPVGSSCAEAEAASAEPFAPTRSEIDTGCAECGGKEGTTSPVDELRHEIADMKTRIAALEEKLAQLDADVGPSFRPVYAVR